ncbi:MAG: polysaccharide biosynthesis/export family protein [Deltaproteobacteria bacterium]|nr:polysaccharide biosynthesis/export family protein [Nannocystaceae bacterium]
MRLASTLIVASTLVMALPACKPRYPYVWANDIQQTEVPVDTVPLRPGDRISVSVPRMEELLAAPPFDVGADGAIVLPLVGPFEVEGLTPEAAARKLNARLNGIVVNPDARISMVSPRIPAVTVVGEVANPARIEVAQGEGVLTALARVGGLTEFADPQGIYVVRKYPKQERIRFRYTDLTGGAPRSSEFELRDGDVIVVE